MQNYKFLLKKIFVFLRKKAFWLPPCLLAALLIYAGFLFYRYVWNPPKISEELSAEGLVPSEVEGIKIKTELYQKTMDRLDQREKILENELRKTSRDIFR